MLKPGGLMVIECPCLDKIFALGAKIDFTKQVHDYMKALMLGLYGAYWQGKSDEMLHRWCYCIAELKGILKRLEFTNIEREEPLYHVPARDMRFVCRK